MRYIITLNLGKTFKKGDTIMGKLLLFLSLLSMVILLIGSVLAPESSTMWLASTSLSYDIARLIFSGGLIALLLTKAPRKMLVRVITGVMAFVIVILSLYMTYQGSIKLLDGMSFAAAALSMGVAALEVGYDPTNLYKKIIGYRQHSKFENI